MIKRGIATFLAVSVLSVGLLPMAPAHTLEPTSASAAQPTTTAVPLPGDDTSQAPPVSDCSDPVKEAIRIIEATALNWTPVGYTVTKAAFIVGRSIAWHGGGYIFMQSPKLATSLAIAGPGGMAKTIGYDLLVEVTKLAIGTPGKASENIAAETIYRGLAEYDVAYGIARKYAENGTLSREDALSFLKNRWGLLKLAAARDLGNRAQDAAYSPPQQVLQAATEEALDRLSAGYQHQMGIDRTLPLITAAAYIRELGEVLEQHKIGIMDYPPYLEFQRNMEAINGAFLNEATACGWVPVIEPVCSPEARFMADVSVPDGTEYKARAMFEKKWLVLNSGDCPWGEGYRLQLVDGERMGRDDAVIGQRLQPSEEGAITASLIAPKSPGTYTGVWQIADVTGRLIGDRLTVVIKVIDEPEQGDLVVGETWMRPRDKAMMVRVPAGEFMMGSDGKYFRDEAPAHPVRLEGFWLDQTEVTNAQYSRCVDLGACSSAHGPESQEKSGNLPVSGVTWDQASAYCSWAGARLPTEAEWEYAARGPESFVYPWGNSWDGTRGNFCDVNCGLEDKYADRTVNDGYRNLAPVGTYPSGASWCGVLDMSGNVSEWVADWFGAYPSDRQVNPAGPASGTLRITRGGTSVGRDYVTNGVYRLDRNPKGWDDGSGLRCALSHSN